MSKLSFLAEFLSYEGSPSNDPADAIKMKNRVEESSVQEISRQQLLIADATVDQSVTLPDPSCDYFLLLVDRQVSIKLNGSSDSIILKPRGNGIKTLAMFYRGTITEVSISNASGDSAKVDIISAKI